MCDRKQRKRHYAPPKDPRTWAQLVCRGRLGNASKRYNGVLTEERRQACIAGAEKVRSRPRLGQCGWLTGQQFWVSRDTVGGKAAVKTKRIKTDA